MALQPASPWEHQGSQLATADIIKGLAEGKVCLGYMLNEPPRGGALPPYGHATHSREIKITGSIACVV